MSKYVGENMTIGLPPGLTRLLSQHKGSTVAVGLSGGVDSSVAALLLKLSGADVIGVFMKNRYDLNNDEMLSAARRVSDVLGIELKVLDVSDDFKRYVIDYFIQSYERGETPNPCVLCNLHIKFGILMDYALRFADTYSTGHYVRTQKKMIDSNERLVLLRGIDKVKDQSYVLSMLSQEVLSRTIFPIGHLRKEKVKRIAEVYGLPIHTRESQDLCFTKDRIGFIKGLTKKDYPKGPIVDLDGNIIGGHEGIIKYAIGQRRGLGIHENKRYYVYDIDVMKNRIVVGGHDDLFVKRFGVKGVNWIIPKDKPFPAEVIVRNKMDPKRCTVSPEGDYVEVVMEEPIWAVAPGQLAVFYEGDYVIGGGWITKFRERWVQSNKHEPAHVPD